MKQFDVIITGTGAAGLWTAYHLSQMNYEGSVLMLDQQKFLNDNKNWSFWAREDEKELISFAEIKWDKGYVAEPGKQYAFSFGDFIYASLTARSFYKRIYSILDQLPNFNFIQAKVEKPSADGTVLSDQGSFKANKLIFNSILNSSELIFESETFLWQHFYGQRVRFKEPYFKDRLVGFMDFDIDQKGDCRFLYVLPYSEHEALLEYTLFNHKLLSKAEYKMEWEQIVGDKYSLDYELVEEELGKIPMCDFKFPKSDGKIYNVGTAGGMVKASTGFAFRNIYYQTYQLCKSFINEGKPKYAKSPKRYQFYDYLLLKAINNNPKAYEIFVNLFKTEKDVPLVLSFLDGKNTLTEDLKVISKCPQVPFLKALVKSVSEIT